MHYPRKGEATLKTRERVIPPTQIGGSKKNELPKRRKFQRGGHTGESGVKCGRGTSF